MKKARKVPGNPPPPPASYHLPAEGAARIKIRSFTQDYDDLMKKTEALKKQLQAAKMKKQTLLAQVKFLRKKYKSFGENPLKNSVYQVNYYSRQTGPSTTAQPPQRLQGLPPPPYGAQHRNPGTRSEFAWKGKNHSEREFAWKGKNHSERESALPTATVGFDLNQSAFNPSKHHLLQRVSPITAASDLPAREASHREKEVAAPSTSGMLDLNQAMDEPEFRSPWEAASSWDRPAKQFTLEAADRAAADLKLAVCRNLGKTSGRSGKRKISWQDQVVLRV